MSKILLATLAMVLTNGCRTPQPASLADWNACVISHARLAVRSDAGVPTLVPENGDGEVLALRAEWGRSPVVSEYMFGELYLGLPAGLSAGAVVTPEPKQGMYREGSQALSFNSTDIGGTVKVLAVDAEHAELELDLVAEKPDIDVVRRAPLALKATVRARVAATQGACD